MTQETYYAYHGSNEQRAGKHCKKLYHVWKVCGPAGPVTEYDILGLEEARESILGTWDAEITRICDGVIMR